MNDTITFLSSNKLASITEEYMKEKLAETKPFTVVILKKGPAYQNADTPTLIWEHGKRIFLLRVIGYLPVVCPVNDDSEVAGVGIFTTDLKQTKEIMNEDPAVKAGVLVSEVHATKSFPGSCLPGSDNDSNEIKD